MRPPVDTIVAPPFPTSMAWVNVAQLRMDKQRGRPVLIEFWDFCRVQSLRTLPYVRAWHERYADAGLRVVSAHTPGFDASRAEDDVREAVARLEISHPVCLDTEFELWLLYENPGWPARYLFDGRGTLTHYHFGEGAYDETELAIQELVEVEREPLAPLRPEDDPEAVIVVPSPDQEGAYSGPYEAGAVWAVLAGRGAVSANGREIPIEHPGCFELISHERHAHGELELVVGPGVSCEATCFTPGLAP
jgi:hypothetical protein